MPDKTITINGKLYDAVTGLPVDEPPVTKSDQSTPVESTKSGRKITVTSMKKILVQEAKKPAKTKPQPEAPKRTRVIPHKPIKSRTLNRAAVRKPAAKVKLVKPTTPAPKGLTLESLMPRIATKPSPIVLTGAKRDKKTTPPLTVKKPTPSETAIKKKRIKIILISIAVLLVLIGGGVASYLFLPPVSFWVASTRANVRASLPTWAPDGFRVDGVVESSPGQVTINYRSSGDASFSLTQQNSNWDSNGVLENKVKPVSRDYQTLTQQGLTIYRFSGTAIWVNGGVLHTISDSNNLINEEILKIIASM